MAVVNTDAETWKIDALCSVYPPWVFFPEDGIGVTTAIRICSNCPVMKACAAYALRNHIDHGVWGGMSERARRRSRRNKKMEFPEPNQECLSPFELPAERPDNW